MPRLLAQKAEVCCQGSITQSATLNIGTTAGYSTLLVITIKIIKCVVT